MDVLILYLSLCVLGYFLGAYLKKRNIVLKGASVLQTIALVALVFVILLYVLIMPRKRDGTFSNRFAQWLHDFFRFKKLYLESVLRFIYAFATFFIMASIFSSSKASTNFNFELISLYFA